MVFAHNLSLFDENLSAMMSLKCWILVDVNQAVSL